MLDAIDYSRQAKYTSGQIFRLMRHNEAVRELFKSIACIKEGIENERYDEAREAWGELTGAEQEAVYIAPKYGGIFTTEERRIIKNGFRAE